MRVCRFSVEGRCHHGPDCRFGHVLDQEFCDEEEVWLCACFQDGYLVAGSDQRLVRFDPGKTEVAQGKCLVVAPFLGGLSVSTEGTDLSAPDTPTGLIAITGGFTTQFESGPVPAKALLSMGDCLVVGSDFLSVFDRNGENLGDLQGHIRPITCLAQFHGYLVSGSEDCTVRLWDLKSENAIHVINSKTGGGTSPIRALTVSGNHLVIGDAQGNLRRISPTLDPSGTIETGSPILALAGLPQGLLVATEDAQIRLYNDNGDLVQSHQLRTCVKSMVPSEDGTHVAAVQEGKLVVWRVNL